MRDRVYHHCCALMGDDVVVRLALRVKLKGIRIAATTATIDGNTQAEVGVFFGHYKLVQARGGVISNTQAQPGAGFGRGIGGGGVVKINFYHAFCCNLKTSPWQI